MSNHINEEIKETKRDQLIEQHMELLKISEEEAIKVVDSMIDNNPDWWTNND